MAITYIAFIDCVLYNTPPSNWETKWGFPQTDNPTTHAVYKSLNNDSEVHLVDIKSDLRYFGFKRGSEVHIINNTIIFDSNDVEEIAVDESVQQQKKSKELNHFSGCQCIQCRTQ